MTVFLNDGNSIDIVYLDFRKAFDTVPHKRLLMKLKSYGITGKIFQWIEDFLVGRSQQVKVGTSLSKKSEVTSGIPQGSILGPILRHGIRKLSKSRKNFAGVWGPLKAPS